MDLKIMYKGIAFSPVASLVEDLGAGDTTIKVDSTAGFPQAPNYATIGTDEQAETIYYGGMTSDTLSGCRRGVEGTAKEWQTGELVGRNFTNKDYETLIANINSLNTGKWETPNSQTKDNFVMFDENGKPVDSGKKASDFDASGAAEKVNETLGQHTRDNKIHITNSERQKWNGAVTDKHTHSNKTVLDGISQEDVTSWGEKTETKTQMVTLSVDSWTPSSGNFEQQLSSVSITPTQQVNLSADVDNLLRVVSPIVPENRSGQLYVVTKEKPDSNIEVQCTIFNLKEVQ